MPHVDPNNSAKKVWRQLNRQTDESPPADALSELESYVEEAYDELVSRTSSEFSPHVHAPRLAEKAARRYAKQEYTGIARYEEQYERAFRTWADQAAVDYHRDSLDNDPYETPATEYKNDISGSANTHR